MTRLVEFPGEHWPLRARVVACFGFLGFAASFAKGCGPRSDIASLAQVLGAEVGCDVSPEDVKWEPSRGVITDFVYGRFALFLGRSRINGMRDVYRARVRLSPEGHPIETASTHNLTATPLGDDHALVLEDTHAAFATFAFGQEQSVTALNTAGEGTQNLAQTSLDHAMAWITNLQQTGSGEGIGRIEVNLDAPAKRVGLALKGNTLAIDLGDDAGERHVSLDLTKSEIVRETPGVHAEPSRHLAKRPIFWAVDTVRAIPAIGPAPVAWLEEKVFAARDFANQTAFKFHANTPEDTLATTAGSSSPVAILESSENADDGSWPPEAIASIWKTPETGEGLWKPVTKPWMRPFSAASGVPSPFATTFVRPDETRPYSHVILVAMDMRQLDLEMEAGTEDPKPLTGQHGPGRIPRDPQIMTRVVAAFNGAFKTEHGNYGMMVHKRVLLPPQPMAATVILTDDGRAAFGTWGATPDLNGLTENGSNQPISEASIVSFRQNLDPLIDHGDVNPTGRALWGYTLPGNGMQTERTGLCLTFSGNLIYAWGDDASATTIGRAMKMAGCDYGLHLDMNPHHTGFIFTTINQIKNHDYHSELLTPLMEVSTDRYIEYAPKDFFYMLMRDPEPHLADLKWQPDAGTQPAPSWLGGLWRSKVGDLDVVLFAANRAGFRLAAGTNEPDAQTGSSPMSELGTEDRKRVLGSIAMGVTREKSPLGLSIAGKNVFGFTGDTTTGILLARAGASLTIAGVNETLDASADAVELPLLVSHGALVTDIAHVAMTHGKDAPKQRAAIGTTRGGDALLVTGETSPLELAQALVRLGCDQALLLDRGAHTTTTVRRAGTATLPLARNEETTLFFLSRPLRPRSFHFLGAGAKR